MLDGLRQVIGNANIIGGSAESIDPLTAPFVLFVDPYIGRDYFAAGSYNSTEAAAGSTTEQIVAQKLKRLENQRLVCGYTRQRPFKTLNRAIIEAAIITSKNWYISDPLAHVDCVCIVLSPALHIVYHNSSTDGAGLELVTHNGGGFVNSKGLFRRHPAPVRRHAGNSRNRSSWPRPNSAQRSW